MGVERTSIHIVSKIRHGANTFDFLLYEHFLSHFYNTKMAIHFCYFRVEMVDYFVKYRNFVQC